MDAGFIAALVAVAFLGPLPAACIWIGTEIAAAAIERVKLTAWLANVASYGWSALAGAVVLAALVDVPLGSGSGVEAYAAVALAGLVMLVVNFFVTRILIAVVRDGGGCWTTVRGELIAHSPATLAMIVLGVITCFGYAQVGVLALGLFAAVVVVPQLLLPALVRPRPVAELAHSDAVALYAQAIGEVMGMDRAERLVLKDGAHFIREQQFAPPRGGLSDLSDGHRLAAGRSGAVPPRALGRQRRHSRRGRRRDDPRHEPCIGGGGCLGRLDRAQVAAADARAGAEPARAAGRPALRPQRRAGGARPCAPRVRRPRRAERLPAEPQARARAAIAAATGDAAMGRSLAAVGVAAAGPLRYCAGYVAGERGDRARRGNEQLMAEEPDLSLFAPDVVLDNSNAAFDGAVYRGHDGLREWLSWARGMWKRQQIEPQEFIPVGENQVISLVRIVSVGRDDVETVARGAALLTVREEKIAHMKTFQGKADALEAAGLSEQDVHANP